MVRTNNAFPAETGVRTRLIDPATETAKWCVAASDQCVMCGLCLPHCPTYALKRNEADSPRGRISLIRAFTACELTPDKVLVGHLEGCLQCRRCEAVCPAHVPFGRLMDTAKQLLFKARVPSLVSIPRWLGWIAASRRLRRLVWLKLYLYHRSGLRWLLRATGILKILGLEAADAMLPTMTATPLTAGVAESAAKDTPENIGRVALFTGCVAEILDRNTLIASKHLLEEAGFAVSVPARQTCCGALHQHAGDIARAKQFIRKNVAAFSNTATNTAPQTVVSCASGCGAQLKEHETTLGIRHFDIHAFLAMHADALDLHPLDETVALHTPCTMSSCLQGAEAVSELLGRIPALKVAALPASSGCCGAAGAYMLTQPRTAQRLLEDTLAPLAQMKVKVLLSSNIGCIMHLRQGATRRSMNVEVTHPAVLISRQLKSTDQGH